MSAACCISVSICTSTIPQYILMRGGGEEGGWRVRILTHSLDLGYFKICVTIFGHRTLTFLAGRTEDRISILGMVWEDFWRCWVLDTEGQVPVLNFPESHALAIHHNSLIIDPLVTCHLPNYGYSNGPLWFHSSLSPAKNALYFLTGSVCWANQLPKYSLHWIIFLTVG